MDLTSKSINELLEIALKTTSLDEMLFLKSYPSVNIRRALAKNDNIQQNIIDSLLYDPVLNVSYIASKHPNNSNFEKKFNENQRPCVLCKKSEIGLICVDCDLVKDHNF